MRFFNHRKESDLVTVEILFRKPAFPEGFKFLKKYQVKNAPELDLKNIISTSFNEANPNCEILNIKLSAEK